MYSLRDYGAMIAEGERFNAYRDAIAKAVRPGDCVLELGCGPGLFAMLACKAGARRVYAIETDDVVELARDSAARNNLAERLEFVQGDSRKAELPERVNVIIADLRGVLPFFAHAIPTIDDARKRLLAPGGIIIPRRDILKAAVIDVADYYCRLTAPWRKQALGIDLSLSLTQILNTTYGGEFKLEQLLTEPRSWAELDYQLGAAPNVFAELNFHTARAGMAHGLCAWFETQLFDQICYSTGPEAPKNVHGQIFFPLLEPVPVEPGQEIRVNLQADLVGGDYVWRWETIIPASGASPARHFRQSTFYGEQLSPASLRRREAGFVPTLSESGQADRWLLHAMDGKASLRKIAQSAAQHFPKIFPRWEDALRRAADLAAQFSR